MRSRRARSRTAARDDRGSGAAHLHRLPARRQSGLRPEHPRSPRPALRTRRGVPGHQRHRARPALGGGDRRGARVLRRVRASDRAWLARRDRRRGQATDRGSGGSAPARDRDRDQPAHQDVRGADGGRAHAAQETAATGAAGRSVPGRADGGGAARPADRRPRVRLRDRGAGRKHRTGEPAGPRKRRGARARGGRNPAARDGGASRGGGARAHPRDAPRRGAQAPRRGGSRAGAAGRGVADRAPAATRRDRARAGGGDRARVRAPLRRR